MNTIIKISIFIFLIFTLIYLYKYRKEKYVFSKYIVTIISIGFFAIAILSAIVDDIQSLAIGVTLFGYFLGYFYE